MNGEKRILAVVHVYYAHLWQELASCLRNVGEGCDIIITYVDESAVEAAKREFPHARFLRCENRGYDVWPFIRALRTVDLRDYDYLVKLHTKRNIDQDLAMNHAWFGDNAWRNYLLRIVSTHRNWRRAFETIRKPGVGMVADRHLIFDREITGPRFTATFDRAMEEVRRIAGSVGEPEHLYVAGTMFLARVEPFKALLREDFTADRFDVPGDHRTETYAHVMERMFGLFVSAVGLRVESFNGSIRWRLNYYRQNPLGKFLRFFFQRKVRDWKYQVKVFQIPIYTKRLKRIEQLKG